MAEVVSLVGNQQSVTVEDESLSMIHIARESILAQSAALASIASGLGDEFDDAIRLIVECSCLLYTSPSPRDLSKSRMPSSA